MKLDDLLNSNFDPGSNQPEDMNMFNALFGAKGGDNMNALGNEAVEIVTDLMRRDSHTLDWVGIFNRLVDFAESSGMSHTMYMFGIGVVMTELRYTLTDHDGVFGSEFDECDCDGCDECDDDGDED